MCAIVQPWGHGALRTKLAQRQGSQGLGARL
jgi:hypothetical protein